jgi:hypothetical protein
MAKPDVEESTNPSEAINDFLESSKTPLDFQQSQNPDDESS